MFQRIQSRIYMKQINAVAATSSSSSAAAESAVASTAKDQDSISIDANLFKQHLLLSFASIRIKALACWVATCKCIYWIRQHCFVRIKGGNRNSVCACQMHTKNQYELSTLRKSNNNIMLICANKNAQQTSNQSETDARTICSDEMREQVWSINKTQSSKSDNLLGNFT